MSLTADRDTYDGGGLGPPWWAFLITGFAWVLIALIVLTVDADTPATIGLLAGFVLIVAGVNELVEAALGVAWRWLHATIGVLFGITGILALLSPLQTFGLLAVLVGWYLLIKGIADIVVSIAERALLPMWGLLLGAGIAQLMIGVWAIGYPGRSAWLLILWVGLVALLRGITELVLAFQLRGRGGPRPAYA
jgi:uncharacterized membrane protein HdeD (DUF308 family)